MLVRPCTSYEGEGIYLLQDVFGGRKLTRASSVLGGPGHILLHVDNKHYGEHLVPREAFEDNVLAIVVADVKVRDARLLALTQANREARP